MVSSASETLLSNPWCACNERAHRFPLLFHTEHGQHHSLSTSSRVWGLRCTQDKINAFWEILKRDLDDRKAELRNKDREMEEMEERHQVEIKVGTFMVS